MRRRDPDRASPSAKSRCLTTSAIALRIGINIGDIIIEDDDIYGDGVNVAARLEQLAEPGGICVARNVYSQVKNKVAFGFESMGEHKVKNIPEPVTAYRAITDPGPIAKTLGLRRAGAPKWRRRWSAACPRLAWCHGHRRRGCSRGSAGRGTLRSRCIASPGQAVDRRVAVRESSGDPEQEYFADGITEDLITDLSKTSVCS